MPVCRILLILLMMFLPLTAFGLTPEEVLVVANKNAAESVGLARYYMKMRQIPKKNLVVLKMTDQEACSRKAYVNKAAAPIRDFLIKNDQIRAIATIYGVPLKIYPPPLGDAELDRIRKYDEKIKVLSDRLLDPTLDPEVRKTVEKQLDRLKKQRKTYRRNRDRTASFDSELSLVKREDYPLNLWQLNPFYLKYRNRGLPIKQSEVMMVSRLDGPSPQIVKRIINDSIEAEQAGLTGVAYFDARWPNKGDKAKGGYQVYDRSLYRAADILEKGGRIKVVLDGNPALFQPGQCPKAAFYSGWYSLARYVDAFEWQKGSVGYHIASAECVTLKKKESNAWCKKMLEKGAAATIGPVGEPYVHAFPLPEIFFKFLTMGHLTLAETYLISQPYLSWKMVLVGDPLYRVKLNP